MLAGNVLILRSISAYKNLQTPTNLFLASFAVADLLITLFLPLFDVSTCGGRGRDSQNVEWLIYSLFSGFGRLSYL